MRNRSDEPPNTLDIRLNDGDDERNAAHVFGSPTRVTVVGKSLAKSPTLRCRYGNMTGRWVYSQACSTFNYSDASRIPPVGHECWQTDGAYQGHNIPVLVKSRKLNYVWRPYECMLNHYIIEEKSRQPPAARCLSDAKIGLLAGFGDSLGAEQNFYLRQLLGEESDGSWSSIWPMNQPNSLEERGYIICDRSKQNTMWLDDHESLVLCILSAIEEKLSNRRQFSNIVIVTNFMIHHAQWRLSLEEIEFHLGIQMKTLQAFREELAERGFTLRLIWFSGVAVHGFRVPGLTPARQVWVNDRARRILVEQGGWEMLDAYNITLGRSDGTCDGLHYRGGVAKAITTVLMNLLCNQVSHGV